MPSLAFGLSSAKTSSSVSKPPQKRKAFFDEDAAEDVAPAPEYGAKKSSKSLRPIKDLDDDGDDGEPPRKSPKLSQFGLQPAKPKFSGTAPGIDKYVNLSALRSAKLHDEEASKIDASVYDYDAAYDTFHAEKEKKSTEAGGSSGPKYMGSLLQSAEVRKRDQLRAREKLLQREREAEGDEYADKEKFVTGAYKKQQEEIRRMEEEEKRREEAEEERRRKGGGMTAFHKRMLEKDEERMRMIKEAEEEVAKRKEGGVEEETPVVEEESEAKMAEKMNKQGARIIVNDEGEVVDKRQLLSAGLNVAPKKPGKEQAAPARLESARKDEYWKSSKAVDARHAQRERQSRMMERQIEEMMEKQKQAEAEEEKQQQEKIKSKVSEADKMSAKERFLQRKREREEEARKKKEAGG
ncbi:uncharacterized protein Z519_05824 [Cladophialophora bantiana CBS 173.52]|uniref:Nuclear speckle splicing regulatory protein 1 N-terminal domain-containing protein n=1 Tax=Cladophialophora bantiana (strain ATCC 10958 / CBS 173.52 / CDC B-1940 / NIH 8579) TaxID=1442370 RepID=A0A0D2I8V2_CLAB1|nr:uncharacterized protein Z519_05824 [Cladophialophora bantiana CBS 173.52]KIW93219.1 hypothetical protein Z519_05824 [Cladophialophora bantiana CBS 173.52]